MRAAYIVDGLRSPFGRYGGRLATIRPDDLAAYLIQKLVERYPQIPLESYDEVVLGCSNQAG